MTDMLGKISDLPQKSAEILLANKKMQEKCEGVPVYATSSSDYIDSEDIPMTIVGHCDCFDLSNDEDRQVYADLAAKFAAASNIEKTFEQHVVDKHRLLVYVAYLEYIKIVEG